MPDVVPVHGDDGRSGSYQASGLPRHAKVVWRAPTDSPVWVSPVLAGDTLVVVDVRGLIYAFDAGTGDLRWREEDTDQDWPARIVSPEVSTAPAVWNTWILIARNGIEILDLRTGESVQTLENVGCPTVVGDVLLVHGLSDGVRALSLPGLEILWRERAAGGFSGWLEASPAISAEGRAYAALGLEANHTYGGVTAFEVGTGEQVFVRTDWNEDCPLGAGPPADEVTDRDDEHAEDDEDDEEDDGPQDWMVFGSSHPVVAEGLVWMMVDRGHEDDGLHIHDLPWNSAEVVGLDPETGRQRWVYELDPRLESQGTASVAVAGGVVYFAVYQGGDPDQEQAEDGADDGGEHRLCAVDIATREARWTRPLPSGAAGSPVIAGGVVYQAIGTGEVCAFDAPTGQPRWSLDLGEAIVNSYQVHGEDHDATYEEDGLAVLPADGMLYVRTARGIAALR